MKVYVINAYEERKDKYHFDERYHLYPAIWWEDVSEEDVESLHFRHNAKEEYRKKVITEEYRLAGIPEDSEGEEKERIEMVVNKRMMTESPMLSEYKLVNQGGILTPDLVQQRKIKPEKVK